MSGMPALPVHASEGCEFVQVSIVDADTGGKMRFFPLGVEPMTWVLEERGTGDNFVAYENWIFERGQWVRELEYA